MMDIAQATQGNSKRASLRMIKYPVTKVRARPITVAGIKFVQWSVAPSHKQWRSEDGCIAVSHARQKHSFYAIVYGKKLPQWFSSLEEAMQAAVKQL